MSKYTIEIEITSASDDAALKQFESSLNTLQAKQKAAAGGAKDHEKALDGLGGAVKNLGAWVAGLVGLNALAQWLKTGATAAMNTERALSQLANMARQFGEDGAAAAAAAEELGNRLQRVGYDDDQVIARVRELLPLTRDYAQAVSAVSLAYDINARTGMDAGKALGIIQDLLAGKTRSLMVAHAELGTTATTTAGAIKELEGAFRGAASELSDTKAQVEALKAELDDLGKAAGGPIAGAILALIRHLREGAIASSDWFDEAGTNARKLIAIIANFDPRNLGTSWATTTAIIEQLDKDFVARSQARWRAYYDARDGVTGGTPVPLKDVPSGAGDLTGDASQPGGAERSTQAALDARARQYEREKELAQKTEQDRAKAAAAEEEREIAWWNRRRAMEMRAAAEAVAREAETVKAKKQLGAEYLEQWKRDEQSRASASFEANRLILTDTRRMTTEELQAHRAALAKQTMQEGVTVDQKVALNREAAAVTRQIKAAEVEQTKLAKMQEVAATINASAQITGSIMGVFGQNKEVAVAQAFISTISGSLQLVPNWPAVVASIAAGMAQIQAIISTEPGSVGGGTSGGVNVSGGSRSMSVQQGYSPGKASSAPANVSTVNTVRNENGGNTTVNVNALTGTQSALAMRELERARVSGAKAYRRATVQRRTS